MNFKCLFGLLLLPAMVFAEEKRINFSPEEWSQLEQSIDRGLEWLSGQPTKNGSIGSQSVSAQPAHTSLAVMAFLSRGHQPGHGPYGKILQRAIDFVLRTQDRYGFFVGGQNYKSSGATYCHAISGTMLAEVIGRTDRNRNERIAVALKRGLEATIKLQQRHAQVPKDRGGWRYISRKEGADADLSVSTWHLLFLRAAKNANYNVPESIVTEASDFVRRCFHSGSNEFAYLPGRGGTITMTGAGVLSLFLAGQYDDPMAKKGIQTLQKYDFTRHDQSRWPYYTCYHCSQAASQAGGDAANSVLRDIAEFLLELQTADGSWPAKNRSTTSNSYTTAMAVLSLSPAYQILPIYQR